jgi:hypothetical protein
MFRRQTPGQERFAQKIEELCQEIARREALGETPDHLVRELELVLLDYMKSKKVKQS